MSDTVDAESWDKGYLAGLKQALYIAEHVPVPLYPLDRLGKVTPEQHGAQVDLNHIRAMRDAYNDAANRIAAKESNA